MGGLFDSDLIPLLFVLVMLANVFWTGANAADADSRSCRRSSRRRRRSSKHKPSLRTLPLNLNAV